MEILQLWRSICQEAVGLAETIARLPDHCECGDADAHLEGRCLCCCTPEQTQGRAGLNCNVLLARLQADLAMLSEDVTLAGPATEAAALETQRLELRRGVFLATSDLQRIVEIFKRVTESVAGFRIECTASRVRALKGHCFELRDHCEHINAALTEQRPSVPKEDR